MSTKTTSKKAGSSSKKLIGDTPLQLILKEDKKLQEDSEIYSLFFAFAGLFDGDLKDNLYLTAFDLDDKYVTGEPHNWLKFLNYNAVRSYIDDFIENQQAIDAKKMLKEDGIVKTSDAITIQKAIEEKRKTKNNNNIVVFLMPQKEYWGADD